MSITPRVIQRTPDLGIKIKLQRLPVEPVVPVVPVCPVPVMEPPVWYGWEDGDGNRLVDLSLESDNFNNDVGHTFDRGLFVAVVDGAQYVHWDIAFTPVLWNAADEEGWRGETLEDTLWSEDFWGRGYASLIDLPADVGGSAPEDYWPMQRVRFRKRGGEWTDNGAYLPSYIAAGNTLSLSLFDPAAAMSGELTAVAKTIEDVEIGRVTLRLIVPCDF